MHIIEDMHATKIYDFLNIISYIIFSRITRFLKEIGAWHFWHNTFIRKNICTKLLVLVVPHLFSLSGLVQKYYE